MSELAHEIKRRRTFAIISHPDAGKTTLTEKLLLYGGAIQTAGSVAARKNRKKTTSDWMELEQQRGISVTTTVLQFEYMDHVLNLLDTPGHQDFSEDTYRTLMAADAAVMLLDNARGVEPQTIKLFKVCRQRGIPIFTFVNKMDRPGMDRLELLEQLEEVLGIGSIPINWPIGDGPDFKGVYSRQTREVHLYERTEHGSKKAPVMAADLADPKLADLLGRTRLQQLTEEIELLDGAGEELDMQAVLNGKLTPVFFGSAITNFGVELFLESFIEMAPAPIAREAGDEIISPDCPDFRGLVFKIQANMDPNHRDRIAFMRVISGKFERDMMVTNPRLGRQIRLTRPQKLFAQDRVITEVAYPGDIVGLTNPGVFAIGDTLSTGPVVSFTNFPRFTPEHFMHLRNRRIEKYKQFLKGIQQLSEEGVVQLFYELDASSKEPILGAVGQLQFEVVQYRLQAEYGVETILDALPYEMVRWPHASPEAISGIRWRTGCRPVRDAFENVAGLFTGEWSLRYLQEDYPEIAFRDEPPVRQA